MPPQGMPLIWGGRATTTEICGETSWSLLPHLLRARLATRKSACGHRQGRLPLRLMDTVAAHPSPYGPLRTNTRSPLVGPQPCMGSLSPGKVRKLTPAILPGSHPCPCGVAPGLLPFLD
ncbi:hypothetical protein NDU88_003047 [Pleurodeles waltl]|uniref:Uncharacterized protein n=1 Tax=Pleurodeles waltl TaxID=8319 RepID=A0AAV7Q7W6_PLEWA|nr:hypothetical protein NDU88_003047 [Pleurodeles waltl]